MMKGHKIGASMPEVLSTKLHHLSETAKRSPSFVFRTLAHLMNEEMLAWAYRQLRKDAAAGVDEVTAQDYEKNLEDNLKSLHQRLKGGCYRAQPLRRVYIEKEDGTRRPLSIPALEDKIAQKAVVEILSRIYESDFLPCSYGYRPGRSPHEAVAALQKAIVLGKVSYVLEADIQDYFGSLVRPQLMDWLEERVADQDLLRLIGKWLRVGVIEDGRLLTSETGTYQGSVISPLLANVYLHEVLDLWAEHIVKPRMKGEIKLIRFADDFVVCFQYRDDAERFQQVLPKRFAKYGLTLHPKKTRLFSFGRFARQESQRQGRKPETFNFLGFTFYCGESRNGRFTVRSKTMSKRLRRGLRQVGRWCRAHRHQPVAHQRRHLAAVLEGHYQYYGIRSNFRCLRQFYNGSLRLWKKWLERRTRAGYISWDRFLMIRQKHPLPQPRITWSTDGFN